MLFEVLGDGYFAAILVVVLTASLWYYRYAYKPYASFPSWRMELRVLYWLLAREKLNVAFFHKLIELSKKYEEEGMFVVWLYKPILIAYGEEIVKFIVQDPSTTCRPPLYKLMEFSMGNGLLVSNGEPWKRQKKSILPAFHIKALKTYVSVMNKNAVVLAEKLTRKENEPISDISHILSEFSLRLIYESSLGVREDETKEEKMTIKGIQLLTEFYIHRIFSPWLHSKIALHIFPYARKVIKADANMKRIYSQILEGIKKSVCARVQSPAMIEEKELDVLDTKPKSFGEIIIEDRLKLPSFSMRQLADEISFLIGAGFDTSAHALMWCFFYLGHYPEIQERLYEEISTIANENLEYADVQDLVYLDCVIKESLRLTSIPIFGRRFDKDFKIGNRLIPKNTTVGVFAFALHRNPDIYPDPEKFNPDRFLDADSKIKPWNYLPFAEGNRPCLGKNFAMLSLKIAIIHVIRKFKIVSLDRMEDLLLKWSIVLTSEKEPCMKFISRH